MAENEKVLASILKSEGFFLLEVREKETLGFSSFNVHIDIRQLFSRIRPISVIDKMFFARNLSVMVGAGLSLTKGLDALANESPNFKFREIINDLSSSVVKGKSFADSLRPHQHIFGILFVNMIEVGETTGKLTLVLRILANQMKKDHDLKRKVRGAMIYPAIILIALLGIGAMMIVYVVPTLSETIKELNVALPLTTRIVLGVSDFAARFAILLAVFIAGGVLIFWRLMRTKIGKAIFDRTVVHLPIFGSLVKKFNTARFCRILSYLLSSGVPIVRSLEITSSVLGNSLYQNVVYGAAGEIQKGKSLHEILSPHPDIFQPLIVQMIGVGEETGKISSMLLRLALFFEADVTETTRNLSTIIEPMLMIIIGIIVGFFAISMLQPIYSSLGNIG